MALDEDLRETLSRHLPHELTMLRQSYESWNAFVTSGTQSAQAEFIRILCFENFWLHARNLIEFFSRTTNGGAGAISYTEFTNATIYLDTINLGDMQTRINEQINHLQRPRGTYAREPLTGADASLVYEAISRLTRSFEEKLTEEARKYWTFQHGSVIALHSDFYQSACTTPTIIKSIAGSKIREENGIISITTY